MANTTVDEQIYTLPYKDLWFAWLSFQGVISAIIYNLIPSGISVKQALLKRIRIQRLWRIQRQPDNDDQNKTAGVT